MVSAKEESDSNGDYLERIKNRKEDLEGRLRTVKQKEIEQAQKLMSLQADIDQSKTDLRQAKAAKKIAKKHKDKTEIAQADKVLTTCTEQSKRLKELLQEEM